MINAISLFSNVGIGEIFLKKIGVNVVVANELREDRGKFFQSIYPDCEMIIGNINDKYQEIIEKAKQKKCDFLIATPPCQGMSVAGKRNLKDERNQLIIPVLDAIKNLEPKYVLIENVPQLIKLKINYNGVEDTVENVISKEFREIYNINKEKILDTKDFGIPQTRKRAIILMSKNKKWEFPRKLEKYVTVRETIGDLPSVEALVDGNPEYFSGNSKKIEICKKINKWHRPKSHVKRHVEIMRYTPTGKSAFENKVYYPKKENGEKVKGYNTTYKRMEWDKPAPTITMANGAISSQCNVHPGRKLKNGEYSDARVLTVYEIMKLFTIPDDWCIPDWVSENFLRQVIGEGIPPLLIKKIVEEVI